MAASRLGSSTAIIGKVFFLKTFNLKKKLINLFIQVGDDTWGKNYIENLIKENVNIKHLKTVEGAETGIAQIQVADDGSNQIIIVAGANNSLKPEDVDEALDLLKEAKVLVCQLETTIDATIHALKNFEGISILNVAPAQANLPEELFTLPSIFCANEHEASVITGMEVTNVEEAKLSAKKLIEMGCNKVIITLGADGVVFTCKDDDRLRHEEATKIDNVVDTTGAGDCFIGALAHYLAQHSELPLYQQIQAACNAATISVQFRGTQSSFPKAKVRKFKKISGKI